MIRQVSCFNIGRYRCCIEVTKVQEILPMQEMTPVPCAPMYIKGLINLRGKIVMAIDVGAALQLGPGLAPDLAMNIICECDGECVGLLVDSVGDVLQVSESAERAIVPSIPPLLRSAIQRLYALPEGIILELDPRSLSQILRTPVVVGVSL